MDDRTTTSHSQAAPGNATGATPMMAQFMEIKAANPDCMLFYRMGDFYELFFEDAEIASRTLSIVLTKRGKHNGADIPMCGVPVMRADEYLQKLIAAGLRVAVCEQMEDPAEAKKRGSKSVVRRDVTRLVTPGTITEEALLDPGRANRFVALARRKLSEEESTFGFAAVDISTGEVELGEAEGAALGPELARLDPREVILPDSLRDDPSLADIFIALSAPLTPVSKEGLEPASAERRIREAFGVATLDAFGDFTRAETAALGLALAYVERTQVGQRPALASPRRSTSSSAMRIDAATRANLELMRTLGGERGGSLLATIDRTLTPGGGRLMTERLAAPLTDIAAITARHDAVEFLVREGLLRDELRERLKRAPDLARALSRLALERGGPRDLNALAQGITMAREAGALLTERIGLPADLAEIAGALGNAPRDLADTITATLHDEPPLMRRDGNFVREGFDPEIDELRLLQTDSRKVIAAMQGRYVVETGCRQLKIKHNNVLGFFLEVPQSAGEEFLSERWRGQFIHRQTMADAMRFSTVELGELETRIVSAADKALRRELAVFERLAREVMAHTSSIQRVAAALSALDVSAALAELAAVQGWVRPHIDDSLDFAIVGGRHPTVEMALEKRGQAFIANDADLSPPDGTHGKDPGGRIMLITGPNMAGKSTYLRQNALIAILAQMGAFVPASAARIGVVDQLFSRVGASDDLARGRSTFMVEMVETAAILNQAGGRALVILDEIGRGTATFDGLSIAWATIEHLHEVNGARALFATHYHELTALSERWPRIANATVKVREWQGEVIFLHEVAPGAADRSYGIQVGKLAGLPPAVVERAKAILSELERTELERPVAAIVDDLPLFAVNVRQAVPQASGPDRLREMLGTIQPDDLSPREALEALYALKKLAN
ncbi:MAG: DNA mismatch repair protein MutS [Bosea sp. (in: a-proteobacteria)]